MFSIAMPPASGVRLSWEEFTAPHEAAVVALTKIALWAIPKRTSLPSMLPPELPAVCAWFAPARVRFGLPARSDPYTADRPMTKMIVIAARMTHPCRVSPANLPTMYASPDGMTRIASVCKKLVIGEGFSNGCAELALKKPPPLVPSSLIDS